MNEDYLWDGSGNDPEIERLEKALAVFRYRETQAPVAQMTKPALVVVSTPRWKFSFACAFAALTVAVILAGVWLRTSTRPGTLEQEVASVTTSQANGEPQVRRDVSADYVVPIDRVSNLDRTSTPLRIRAKRTAALPDRRAKTKGEGSQDRNGIAALTREEKYAYGQLMLALSITSSKLKIIKDTINGTAERENAAKENER